jgi:hypothetical protein
MGLEDYQLAAGTLTFAMRAFYTNVPDEPTPHGQRPRPRDFRMTLLHRCAQWV